MFWLPWSGDQPDIDTVYAEHNAIFEAIEAEDAELASHRARRHAVATARRIRRLHVRSANDASAGVTIEESDVQLP